MRIAVCDDEVIFHQELHMLLDKYAKERKTDILYDFYKNGHLLVASPNEYDVIFLDYQMKEINGLDTARKIRHKNQRSAIIFLTSFSDIVYEAFEVNAFRFLLKPINQVKLFSALDDYMKEQNTHASIQVDEDDNLITIYEDEIIYAEASGKHCYIRTPEKSFLYKKTLSELEDELPKFSFFRSHRTYLVNFKYIVSHTKTDILFNNNEKALISKLKLTEFKNAYITYLKSCSSKAGVNL